MKRTLRLPACSARRCTTSKARTRSAPTTLRSGAPLARVLSAGAVPVDAAVSEWHILDLEREAFLPLCGEPKTRERIRPLLTKSILCGPEEPAPCVTSPFFRRSGRPSVGRRAGSQEHPP